MRSASALAAGSRAWRGQRWKPASRSHVRNRRRRMESWKLSAALAAMGIAQPAEDLQRRLAEGDMPRGKRVTLVQKTTIHGIEYKEYKLSSPAENAA